MGPFLDCLAERAVTGNGNAKNGLLCGRAMKSLYNYFVKAKEGYELAVWVVGVSAVLGIGRLLSPLLRQCELAEQVQRILSEPLGIVLVVIQLVLLAILIWGVRLQLRLREDLAAKTNKLDELEIQLAKGSLSGPEFEWMKFIWRPILLRVDGGEGDTIRVRGPMCPKCKTPLVEGTEVDQAGPLTEYFGYCAECPDHFSTANDSFVELTKAATAIAIGRFERGELKFPSKKAAIGATFNPPAKPRLMDRPNDDLAV